MEQRKCKNKKCQRPLSDGYKHKYCESCCNIRAKRFKDGCKGALGVVFVVGGTAVTLVTNGKINLNKK